jgi:cytochrome subunit of sulfide dehydrogenase
MLRIKINLCFSRFIHILLSLIVLSVVGSNIVHSAETIGNNDDVHIRTLAASCAACHGTNGNSFNATPALAGLNATYFMTQMQAFTQNRNNSTVMHHHAKGLNAQEIQQLAYYFSQQARLIMPPLPSQTLDVHHD